MSNEVSPVHLLVAEASGTDVRKWVSVEGPAVSGQRVTAWYRREAEGVPDIYAVASGDENDTTVELIPAAPGEANAFDVMRALLRGSLDHAETDIECGVVHQGPVPRESGLRI